MEDFYLNQRGLASYYEAQWLDHLLEKGLIGELTSQSKKVPFSFIQSSHCIEVASFIEHAVRKAGIMPKSLLEVGAALGRNFYETTSRLNSIQKATLVEPSNLLLSGLKQILFTPPLAAFNYIYSLDEMKSFEFENQHLVGDCQRLDVEFVDQPFSSGTINTKHDLVVCLNVLDQCDSPLEMVNALKSATNVGGILVASCTYQWNKKHIQNMDDAVDDINEYFDQNWQRVSEANHEYRIRFNDRFSRLFLSHAVAYIRKA